MKLQNLIDKTELRSSLITTDTSDPFNVSRAERFSVQAIVDVDTPSAKTFDSEAAAALVDQSLTYTAVDPGTAGNDITIELVDPGAEGVALDVEVTDTAIVVTLETSPEVAAALEDQGLTYTALAAGAAGNDITIALIDPPGNNEPLSVLVTGTDIVVTLATDGASAITSTADDIKNLLNADDDANDLIIVTGTGATPVTALAETNLADGDDGGVILSTGDEVKAAVNADAEALLLVLVSGSNGSAVAALAETPLAGGVDSEVEEDGANTVRIPAHGLPTGLKGQLTTTGGLPTGLSGGTDYFWIADDPDFGRFANSLANALAGTAITITGEGTGVHTFTPTSLAGAAIKLQKSNSEKAVEDPDNASWSDVAAATSITADGTVWLEDEAPTYRAARVHKTLTAGSMSVRENTLVKGYV